MIFFILEAIITANSISMNQVSQDSIEKPEKSRRGPATVSASESAGDVTGETWEGAEER